MVTTEWPTTTFDISISSVANYELVSWNLFTGIHVRPINTAFIYSYVRNVVTVDYINQSFGTKGTLCDSNLNPISSENSYEYYITNNQNAPIALQTYVGSNPLPTNRSIHFINNPSDSIGMYLMAEVKANGKTATLNINVAPDQ